LRDSAPTWIPQPPEYSAIASSDSTALPVALSPGIRSPFTNHPLTPVSAARQDNRAAILQVSSAEENPSCGLTRPFRPLNSHLDGRENSPTRADLVDDNDSKHICAPIYGKEPPTIGLYALRCLQYGNSLEVISRPFSLHVV
jgi:hypothetical protein